MRSHKQVRNFVAHTDAVTSLLIPSRRTGSQALLSGGHDGALRAWDLRTFHLVFDTTAHRRKYDEGLLSLAASE